jgi:hypothetical protein
VADEFDAEAALRAYRRRCRRLLFVGLPCLIAFIVATNLVYGRASDLERTGVRYPGTIVEVDQARGTGSGSLIVEFQADMGVKRWATIRLNDGSPHYGAGEPTVVIVDPNDPDHLSIPGETNQSRISVLPMIALLVAGGLLTIAGIGGLLRARRQASMLRRSGWSLRHGSFRQAYFPSVQLTSDGHTVRLTICSVFRDTPQKAGFVEAKQFMLAGDPDGYCLIRVPDFDWILSARPPLRWFASSR